MTAALTWILPPMQTIAPSMSTSSAEARPLSERLGGFLPQILLAPSIIVSFIYVFGFSIWTFYILSLIHI